MWLFKKEKAIRDPLEYKLGDINFPLDLFGRDNAILKEAISFVKQFVTDESLLLDIMLHKFEEMKYMYKYQRMRFDILLDQFMEHETLYTLKLLDSMYDGARWWQLEHITKHMQRSTKTLSTWLKVLEDKELLQKKGDMYALNERGRNEFPPTLTIGEGFLSFFVVANQILKKNPASLKVDEFLDVTLEQLKAGIYVDFKGILTGTDVSRYKLLNFIMFRIVLLTAALDQEPLRHEAIKLLDKDVSDSALNLLRKTEANLSRSTSAI